MATAQMRADGSTVDVDAESAKLAENAPRAPGAVQVARGPHRHHRDRDGHALMGLFDALDISASGLTAERMRMDVTAENLANAQTTRTRRRRPYRRKEVVAPATAGAPASARSCAARCAGGRRRPGGGGVEVAGIAEDATPLKRVYDPGHPDADAEGYVRCRTSTPVTEMVDLISASRAYEANVTAMQTAKPMFTKTLDILR